MPLPPKLTKFTTASPSIATYSWETLASGTGYIRFYPARTTLTGAVLGEFLSEQIVYSNPIINTGVPSTQDTFTKDEDIDFDIVINSTRTVRGFAIVNVPFGVRHQITGSTDVYIIVKIRHFDGSTETDLGSAQGNPLSANNTGASYNARIECFAIDLSERIFKSGDILRVTIELWSKWNINSTGRGYYFGHDPKNRDGGITTIPANVDSNAIIDIPFKPNI